MSVKVIGLVWDHFPYSGADLLAMLALADWSDDDGRCFPSVASLARKTRLSESQARRNIHRLIENGYVQVVGNASGGAPGASRQYQIILGRLTANIDATPGIGATPRMDARDVLHGCAETASTHDTLTVIEPSKNRQSLVPGFAEDDFTHQAESPKMDSGSAKKSADPRPPDCPHQEIIAIYHQQLPTLPAVRVWNDARKKQLQARWREQWGAGEYRTHEDGLEYWSEFFVHVGRSDFLMGRQKSFRASLDWLTRAVNFAKTIEGFYDNRRAA